MSSKVKTNRTSAPPPIDSISIVGKSWYTRGTSYWIRRSLGALLSVFYMCVLILLAVGITIGIVNAGVPASIMIPVMVVACAASSIYNGVKMHRRQRDIDDAELGHAPVDQRKTAERRRRRGLTSTAGAAGLLSSALGGFGGLILALLLPLAVGLGPLLVWSWLKECVPGEEKARRKVVQWAKATSREHEIPSSWKAGRHLS